MFIAALFIMAKTWKQPKRPSADEYTNKTWYSHTMEYSAIKKNEVLTHATTWRDLDNVMLSESSQTQKTTRCLIPFMWNVRNS